MTDPPGETSISTSLNQKIKGLRQNHHTETLINKMCVQRDLENILEVHKNFSRNSKKWEDPTDST